MIFLLVFCLLGILPVLYICILYTVVSLFLSVCCILCSVKHWSREVLLAGFVWLLRVTRESDWRACFCEHQGEETLCVFFLLGGKFDQLQVTPAAVKPYCLYAPVVWLVSSYGLVSDFCVRCRVNRAKKILRHGLQHAAMIIPIPKPQDPLRYAWFIPHKENSKEGRPGRLAAIAAWPYRRQDSTCATPALAEYISCDVDCKAFGAPLAFVIVWWLHQVQRAKLVSCSPWKSLARIPLEDFFVLWEWERAYCQRLFFIHWLLWKHRVVSSALNQMCVLQKRFDRKWGRGH